MAIIAITSNTSWYLYNFRKNTILALLEEGHEVIALAPYDQYSGKLEAMGCQFFPIAMDQGGTNPISDLRTLVSFYCHYRKAKPNIVLNYTPKNNIYSTLAASAFKIPCINNVAGLGLIFVNSGLTTRIARVLYRLSQPLAKKIFFQNEDDRSLFLQHKLAKEEQTDRLPGSGVDLSRFKPVEAPDDATIRFILVARMLKEKGVYEYVEAARSLKKVYPNTEFRLLGFLDVNNPSAIARETMDRWQMEGVINYLDVSDCVENEIALADCVVLPSYYREGVPKSLLEAGAMAKPIITTDSVGCRDVVDDGINGFLCRDRDAIDLADKLEKIIQMSHKQRLSMGEKSREKMIREFDERFVIAKYKIAIQQILTTS